MQDTFIGIDVSKDKIDVAFLREGKTTVKEFSNSKKGFDNILTIITRDNLSIKIICMESTGKYSDGVAEFFYALKFPVSIANPLQVKRFGQSALMRNKTDKSDARVIAQFAEAMKPKLWQPHSPERKKIKNLVRQLEHVKNQLVKEQTRQQEEKDEFIKNSIIRAIDFLNKEVKLLRNEIESLMKNDADISEEKRLLTSIPGIGNETASRLIANLEMNRFESAKQVSAFAGLSPQQHQSGSSIRGKTKISKQGDRQLRRALYMPAVVAIKCNPVIKPFYEKLVGRGMAKKAALCACMRKLLHISYGVLKTQSPFSAEHISQGKLVMAALKVEIFD
jgi:transposase